MEQLATVMGASVLTLLGLFGLARFTTLWRAGQIDKTRSDGTPGLWRDYVRSLPVGLVGGLVFCAFVWASIGVGAGLISGLVFEVLAGLVIVTGTVTAVIFLTGWPPGLVPPALRGEDGYLLGH
jgi:hypothetical protein